MGADLVGAVLRVGSGLKVALQKKNTFRFWVKPVKDIEFHVSPPRVAKKFDPDRMILL